MSSLINSVHTRHSSSKLQKQIIHLATDAPLSGAPLSLSSDEAQELDLCFFNEERTVVSVGCDQCDRTRATVCVFEHTHTHFSYFIRVIKWPRRYVAATIFTSEHLLDLGQWVTPQLWHFIWHCTHCTVH